MLGQSKLEPKNSGFSKYGGKVVNDASINAEVLELFENAGLFHIHASQFESIWFGLDRSRSIG